MVMFGASGGGPDDEKQMEASLNRLIERGIFPAGSTGERVANMFRGEDIPPQIMKKLIESAEAGADDEMLRKILGAQRGDSNGPFTG